MQMTWLALAGYTSVSMDRYLAGRTGNQELPRKPVVITFDDGFADCVRYAVPVLKARGMTAVFFLVAGLMGGQSEWLRAKRGVALELMDWATAKRLAAEGFEIGAHSLTHPHLTALSEAECRAELTESRRVLEQGLGTEIRHLAYPYGSVDDRVMNLAGEAGYRTACSVEIGFSRDRDPLLSLHRVPVTGLDSFPDFVCRLAAARPVREMMQRASDRFGRTMAEVTR